MTTSVKQNPTTAPTLELPTVEDVTQQMRDLNERLVESSRSAALTALDAFEKALQGVGDLEQKAAAATQLDWVTAAATGHRKFVSDVTAPYTTAVRDLLT